jgi:hypothetical protein
MPRDISAGGDVPEGDPASPPRGKEEFAACLRELRAQAGSPSFRQLARTTNYSSSTLADATSGRRLPTEPVVKALVSACGADPAPWLEDLRRVAAAEQAARPAGEHGTDAYGADGPVAAGRGMAKPTTLRFGGWSRVLAFTAAALAVFAAGLGTGRLTAPPAPTSLGLPADSVQQLPGVPPFSGTPTPAPTAGVGDGTDPVAGRCTADARLVDKVPVMRDGTQIGALELKYSPRCGAGWARIYLYPGEPTMLGEATVRSADDRFSTMTDPLVRQIAVYTDVEVPGPGGCLAAGGAIWEQGQPVATASIPCEVPGG